MNLQELQDQAYATSCEKGWHDRPLCPRMFDATRNNEGPFKPDHDRILAKHALIHSEITEAHEAATADCFSLRLVDSKPEGFVVEIADAIIRIADTTAALAVPLRVDSLDWWGQARRLAAQSREASHATTLGTLTMCTLAIARQHIDHATEMVRVDRWAAWGVQHSHAVLILASTCAGLGLDLPQALAVKMAYNKTRPIRHGGKSA